MGNTCALRPSGDQLRGTSTCRKVLDACDLLLDGSEFTYLKMNKKGARKIEFESEDDLFPSYSVFIMGREGHLTLRIPVEVAGLAKGAEAKKADPPLPMDDANMQLDDKPKLPAVEQQDQVQVDQPQQQQEEEEEPQRPRPFHELAQAMIMDLLEPIMEHRGSSDDDAPMTPQLLSKCRYPSKIVELVCRINALLPVGRFDVDLSSNGSSDDWDLLFEHGIYYGHHSYEDLPCFLVKVFSVARAIFEACYPIFASFMKDPDQDLEALVARCAYDGKRLKWEEKGVHYRDPERLVTPDVAMDVVRAGFSHEDVIFESDGDKLAVAMQDSSMGFPLPLITVYTHDPVEQLINIKIDFHVFGGCVPRGRLAAVLHLITRANFGTHVGSFRLNVETGALSYSASIRYAHLSCNYLFFDCYRQFKLCLSTYNRYFGAIVAVIMGADPYRSWVIQAVKNEPDINGRRAFVLAEYYVRRRQQEREESAQVLAMLPLGTVCTRFGDTKVQPLYACRTCNPDVSSTKGCCFVCASRCHAGHNLVEVSFGHDVCSCERLLFGVNEECRACAPMWECTECTFLNNDDVRDCQMCTNARRDARTQVPVPAKLAAHLNSMAASSVEVKESAPVQVDVDMADNNNAGDDVDNTGNDDADMDKALPVVTSEPGFLAAVIESEDPHGFIVEHMHGFGMSFLLDAADKLNGARKEELEQIPTEVYHGGPDEQDCRVCLSTYEENDVLRSLSCGHTFHKGCADRWLLINSICPICRQPAVGNQPGSDD